MYELLIIHIRCHLAKENNSFIFIQVKLSIEGLKTMLSTGACGTVHETHLVVEFKNENMPLEQICFYENDPQELHAEEKFLTDFSKGMFPEGCTFNLYINFTPCKTCCDKMVKAFIDRNIEVNIYALARYRKGFLTDAEWINKMKELKTISSINVLSIEQMKSCYCYFHLRYLIRNA